MNETIAQDVAKFNEASGGALVLSNEPFDGDFSIKSAFQSIGGLVRRRNVYGDGTVQAKRLKEMLNVAVKVAAGTAPVEFEPGQYAWTLRNPELAAVRIGEQLAKARMGDMLNAAVRCAVAAIGNNTGMKHDASTAKPTFNSLNAAAAKFGDRSGSLRAWVMHSTVAHNLYDNALTNAESSVYLRRHQCGARSIRACVCDYGRPRFGVFIRQHNLQHARLGRRRGYRE